MCALVAYGSYIGPLPLGCGVRKGLPKKAVLPLRGSLQVPFTTRALAFAYSMPNMSTGDVQLDAASLHAIFLQCSITSWNDSYVTSLNDGPPCASSLTALSIRRQRFTSPGMAHNYPAQMALGLQRPLVTCVVHAASTSSLQSVAMRRG